MRSSPARLALLPWLGMLVLAAGCRDMVLPLPPLERLSAQVTDHEGVPVPSYWLSVHAPSTGERLWRGIADHLGHVVAPLPSDVAYDLHFRFQGSPHLDVRMEGREAGPGGVRLELPAPNFRARVLLPEGFPEFPVPVVGRIFEGQWDVGNNAEIAVDAEGWFELHAPWEELYARAFAWGSWPRFQYKWVDPVLRSADPPNELRVELAPRWLEVEFRGEAELAAMADVHWASRESVGYGVRKPIGSSSVEFWAEADRGGDLVVSSFRDDVTSSLQFVGLEDSLRLELAELAFEVILQDQQGGPLPGARILLNNYYELGRPALLETGASGEASFWTRPMLHHMELWVGGERLMHEHPGIEEDARVVLRVEPGGVRVIEGEGLFRPGSRADCGHGTRGDPSRMEPAGP